MTKYRTPHQRRGDKLRPRTKRVLASYPTGFRRGPRNTKVTPLRLMAEEMQEFADNQWSEWRALPDRERTIEGVPKTWANATTLVGSLASFTTGSGWLSHALDMLERFLDHKEAEFAASGLPVAPETTADAEESEQDRIDREDAKAFVREAFVRHTAEPVALEVEGDIQTNAELLERLRVILDERQARRSDVAYRPPTEYDAAKLIYDVLCDFDPPTCKRILQYVTIRLGDSEG